MTVRNFKLLAIFAASVAAVGFAGGNRAVSAAILAQDSFNYASGTAISGLNGGTGWSSSWTLGAGAATAWTGAVNATNGAPGVSATNLAYSAFGGTGDAGGSLQVDLSVAGGNGGAIFRTFASPISTTTAGTFWGSVEFKANTSVKFQNFYQLMMSDTPNITSGLADPLGTANGSLHAVDLLAIGAGPVNAANTGSASPTYYADADGGAGVQLSAGADTAQHMAIFEIDTGVTDPSNSAAAIRVSTWFDQSLATALGAPAAVQYYDLSAAEQSGTITGMRLQGSNQGSTTSGRNFLLDEVAFGTTAQDVGVAAAQVPEPASLSVLAVGGMALLSRPPPRRQA